VVVLSKHGKGGGGEVKNGALAVGGSGQEDVGAVGRGGCVGEGRGSSRGEGVWGSCWL